MAIVSRTLGIRNITLKSDTAEAESDKTTFKIKILSAKEAAALQDIIAKSESGSLVYLCVEKALTGWQNLLDANGNALPFNTKNQSANLDLLDMTTMAEIAEEVLRLSFPDNDGELQKN